MSDDLIFEDPPEHDPTGRRPVYLELLKPLMDHPRCWVRLREVGSPKAANQAASRLRTGRATLPGGRWEFDWGEGPNGEGYVYARYLGDNARRLAGGEDNS